MGIWLSDEEKMSLRDYWNGFAGKMSDVGQTANVKLSEAGRKASEATKVAAAKTSEWASKKKDAIDERRYRENPKYSELETIHGVIPPNPILPPIENLAAEEGKVVIEIQEYENLQIAVESLQLEQARTSQLMEQVVSLEAVNEQVSVERDSGGWTLVSKRGERREVSAPTEQSEPPEGLTREVGKSLNETIMLLGTSVVWLVALVGIDYYTENSGAQLWGYSPGLVIWSAGTALWSLFVLWRLRKAKTLLSMPLGMRVQTAIGIGLATAMALILMKEEQAAITNVWGWVSTVALTTLLLSGFLRGFYGTMRKLGGRHPTEIVEVEAVDISSN